MPRLAPLVEPILAGRRAPRDLGLAGLARFLDAVDELVPEVRLLLHTDQLRLPMAGPGGETEWADSVLAKSQFHLALQRDPRWTVAASTDPVLRVHRVLVNWTYLHMTRLGIAPAQRLALCRIAADIVDRNPDIAHWLTAGAADIARRNSTGTTALRYARRNRTGSTIPTSVDWSRLPAERVEPDRHLVKLPGRPWPEPPALPTSSAAGWGFFLQHTGGVSRVRFEAGIACGAQRFLGPVHRVVASAGRRYPGEVHALLGDAVPGAPVGRYEPLYHALAVPANPSATTETAPPAAAVVITPWRTRFKYGEFAYRLQCMDAGVLVGQALEVGRAISWDLEVCYYFPDTKVDRLLGIDGVRSRTYALLGCGCRPGAPTYRSGNGQGTPDTAIDQDVDRVARANSGRPQVEIPPLLPRLEAGVSRWVDLPDTPPTVPDWTQRRSSLGFVDRKPVDVTRLAGVLRRMCQPYRSDVPGGRSFAQTALVAAVGDVSDLAPGVYLVADDGRRLGLLREGDVRPDLQRATTRAVFGIEHMPVVLTLLGDHEAALPAYGDRWLRVQGMEAGIAVQRAHLAGEANSLACQAHCGFDPDQLLSILGVADQHLDPLIQLLIGRPKSAGLAYELVAL